MIIAPALDSSFEGAYVTVRLVHGVSVTVATEYVVSRDPSLNGKDKPNFSSVRHELHILQRVRRMSDPLKIRRMGLSFGNSSAREPMNLLSPAYHSDSWA